MKAKPTIYRCPNKCGDSRYPQPKWTTQAGYDAHIAKCPKSPEAVAKKLADLQAIAAKSEVDQLAAIARAKHKVGDVIHVVSYRVVSPARELMRSGGIVRVRYYAASDNVRSVIGLSGGDFAYNHSILSSDIYPTPEEAQQAATDRQRKHDEALKFAQECR